ncbi:MAG: hypothetical protein ABR863_05140 [Roseiarcus sp.]|jgi:hypothetical protein
MFSFDERLDARETAKEALRPAPVFAWPPRADRRDASRIVLGGGAEIAAAGCAYRTNAQQSRAGAGASR